MSSIRNPEIEGNETIVAIATAPGMGAIGIIRISGNRAFNIVDQICFSSIPEPRKASLRTIRGINGEILDEAIVLVFPGPDSFTGENVIELQCHGGMVILAMILERVLELGARLARPGEFSERAFFNGRLDLTQAEAIADLIAASSRRAAKSAAKSMRGAFSKRINALVDRIMSLRAHIEADLDFSDEPIDMDHCFIGASLATLADDLHHILKEAKQGERLNRGFTAIIVGKPNVGKSSLLNTLAGHDVAIVTSVAGTTRDLLRSEIELDGFNFELMDTAGLRETDNPVEKEGVIRALKAARQADLIIHLLDDQITDEKPNELDCDDIIPGVTVFNKVDLTGNHIGMRQFGVFGISALTGEGVAELKLHIVNFFSSELGEETPFLARTRQIFSLKAALNNIERATDLYREELGFELIAEELRLTQDHLGEITGQVTNEDLLGVIFSTFCIGK